MARPLTRAQALQNRAFLKLLRRTGNIRLACREVGAKYGTMQHRRGKHPAFAVRWDAALAFAQARLDKVGPSTGSGEAGIIGPGSLRRAGPRPTSGNGSVFRTAGGEMTICRRNDGKLQMRRAQPGKLTLEAEQAFLSALSATCNIQLACAAVGAAFNAFNRRRKAGIQISA